MITLRLTTNVKADRRVVLTLPPEVPTGQVNLLITIELPQPKEKQPRTSLAAWADANAENMGTQLSSENVEGFTGRKF
jgi:hypothetical protein